jgi:hypothetical protein
LIDQNKIELGIYLPDGGEDALAHNFAGGLTLSGLFSTLQIFFDCLSGLLIFFDEYYRGCTLLMASNPWLPTPANKSWKKALTERLFIEEKTASRI